MLPCGPLYAVFALALMTQSPARGGEFLLLSGLGTLPLLWIVQAAFNRDYTLILGTTIFFATLIIVFNLLADIVTVWLNPRLRDSSGGSN